MDGSLLTRGAQQADRDTSSTAIARHVTSQEVQRAILSLRTIRKPLIDTGQCVALRDQ